MLIVPQDDRPVPARPVPGGTVPGHPGLDDYDPAIRANLAAGVDEVLTLAQDLGGIMEYCHGVGVKLNHLLNRELGASRPTLRALKTALDPAGIMNPGKLGL